MLPRLARAGPDPLDSSLGTISVATQLCGVRPCVARLLVLGGAWRRVRVAGRTLVELADVLRTSNDPGPGGRR
jgi:hypothetical protein